ncbi:hypothetical protein [Nocardia sp. NPDC004860]|uniref:hypothetical protein n=1 Tax=Nocardia sp. NPDC004860 TaxID=3154557 RepID=UPI0033A44ADF
MDLLITVYLMLIGVYIAGLAVTRPDARYPRGELSPDPDVPGGTDRAADPWRLIGHCDEPPAAPLTLDQAHTVMQAHRRCRVDTCNRKQAAFQELVAAGRLVPDHRAEGYAR